MSRIAASTLLLFVVLSSLAAKDNPFQIVTWPDSGRPPVLRFTFSNTIAESLSDKTIGTANFSLYVFDKDKARVGEGYINLTNIGAGQIVKFQITLSASGNPTSVALSTTAPRTVSITVNFIPHRVLC